MASTRLLQYAGILSGSMISTYIFASLTPHNPNNKHENGSDDIDTTETPEATPLSIDDHSPTIESHLPLESLESFKLIETTDNETISSSSTYDTQLLSIIYEQSISNSLLNVSNDAKQLATFISKYGLPSTDNLRFHESFISSVNYATKQPNWVAEYLTPNDFIYPTSEDGTKLVDRSNSKWQSDPTVPLLFRSEQCDYWRSGYSRGHLARAGNHNDTQLKKDVTFFLSSNIVPQELSMNGCDWYRLETYVQKLVESKQFDHCWVISGPVFKPFDDINVNNNSMNLKFIGGPNQNGESNTKIPIPSHLFKIILTEKDKQKDNDQYNDNNNDTDNQTEKEWQCAAFLMGNYPSAANIPTPLTDYQVDLKEIEKWTGLQFFPFLLKNENSNLNTYDLCAKYGCIEGDNSRSEGWRYLGLMKTATNFEDLDMAYKRVLGDAEKEGKDWLIRIRKRDYDSKKSDIIDSYNKRIQHFRQFANNQ